MQKWMGGTSFSPPHDKAQRGIAKTSQKRLGTPASTQALAYNHHIQQLGRKENRSQELQTQQLHGTKLIIFNFLMMLSNCKGLEVALQAKARG